jgi:hypothetical protein
VTKKSCRPLATVVPRTTMVQHLPRTHQHLPGLPMIFSGAQPPH